MKIVAVIPAYNEEKMIETVLNHAAPFVDEIIVINDGSFDKTALIARSCGAIVYSHLINRGLGAALGTGFRAAQNHDADIVLTLDADGQHDVEKIPLFILAIQNGADVVIGSRMLDHLKGMPFHRKLATFVGNMVTYTLFGVKTTDSQSGFRALSQRALKVMEMKTNRWAISSEILFEAHRHQLSIKEVPIPSIYNTYSLSKGQNFFEGIKTLKELILRRLMHK